MLKKALLCFSVFFFVSCGNDEAEIADVNLDINASKNFSSPILYSYDNCQKLSDDLKNAALEKMRTQLAMQAKNMPTFGNIEKDGIALPTAAPAAGNASADVASAPVEGVDFSGTNNQEKGIDEADIVKTDGKFFYALNKDTLTIVEMPTVGELKEASVVQLSSPGTGILLNNDQAYVIANDYSRFEDDENRFLSMPSFRQDGRVRVDTIDLSADRKAANLSDSSYFEGELVAARKIGDKIYLATYQHNEIPDLILYPQVNEDFYNKSEAEKKSLWAKSIKDVAFKNEEQINNFDFLQLVPKRLEKVGNKIVVNDIGSSDCRSTFGASDASSSGFLSLITLDPEKNEAQIERVRGNRPIVYASGNQVILASPEHESWWFFNNENLLDQTTIHRFDINNDGKPSYHNSLRIPGTINNSFSLSERKGFLRVATTTSPRFRTWLSPQDGVLENEVLDENHLFILGDNNGDLEVKASIEGLAPGEKIWSARFLDDVGFLVTFERVDPLFSLDLKDPLNPKVAGELKIPGVSTYLQEIGDGYLLAVGYGGDEEGLDFQTTVSLFDVSDLSKPKLADKLEFSLVEDLKNSWSNVSSEANNNHLAVNYFSPVAMTAIPLNTSRYVQNPLDLSGGQYEYVSKLSLVDTKVGEKLKVHGEVDHSRFYNEKAQPYYENSNIRRSYFVGDHIYAISSKALTATRLSDMKTTGEYLFR